MTSYGFSPGFKIDPRDYGIIAKCPYCSATNIKRLSRNQRTCGSEVCRAKKGNTTPRKRQKPPKPPQYK